MPYYQYDKCRIYPKECTNGLTLKISYSPQNTSNKRELPKPDKGYL